MSSPDHPPPKAPLGGRLAWWPFVVALLVVAVLVIVVVVVGGGTTGSNQQGTGLTGSGAVACPEFFEHANTPWVPAKPAGVTSKNKMVPKLHPTHVTICRYAEVASTARSARLDGYRELTGDLDKVVDTLRALPAASKSVSCGGLPGRDYLIGMRYAEAIVWVSPARTGCGASNGTFTSSGDVSSIAAASFTAGRWVSSSR